METIHETIGHKQVTYFALIFVKHLLTFTAFSDPSLPFGLLTIQRLTEHT